MQACVFQQRKIGKKGLVCFLNNLCVYLCTDLGVYEVRLNEPLSRRPSAPTVCNYINYVGKRHLPISEPDRIQRQICQTQTLLE